ncbi:MAG: ArsR/SmtB family transcription factor [Thermodesulfobacteriota bacterium]
MAEPEEMARVFKVLAVPARVRLLQILKSGSLCVNALAQELEMSPAAVSQHLRVLRDSGLIKGRKHGYYVHYEVEQEALQRWRFLAQSLLSEPLDKVLSQEKE